MVDLADREYLYLIELADALDNVGRLGADADEPEGARWIEIPLARQIAARLRAFAEGWDGEWRALAKPSDKEYLIELADVLDNAIPPRLGADIEISDTLARQIAARLRAIAERIESGDADEIQSG